ncbi:fyuA [Symbiodinium pilosum]|uniref:FyuA protein n=1 Tax=Symbiodinium pilosum TaxID=2952 RepID=A0A812NJL2_SYMPI|nr:fyuA [Symbiodinium pilosum]
MSVQVLDGQELRDNGIDSLADVVKFVPGASVVSSTAPGFETVILRGIASGTTGDATVGYYVDDVAFGVLNLQIAPPTNMYDLERIEVLRGPQGTLYGQGSMGGTIKVITPKPDTEEFSGRFRVGGRTVDDGDSGYNLDGVVNLPLSDNFAVRLSGGVEERPGWVDSPEFSKDDINELDSWNLRLKALYTTDLMDVTFTHWTVENELVGANSFSRLDPLTGIEFDEPTMAGIGGNPGFIDTSLDTSSLTIDVDLDGMSFISATSYTEYELDFVFPLFTAGFQFFNDSTFQTEALSQEFRLVSTDDSAVQWQVGAYYSDSSINSDIDFFLDFGGGITIPVIDTIGDIESEAWAVFGEVSVELLDGLVVPSVGLRYFEDDRTTANGIDRATGLPRPPVGTTYETVNPRFAVNFRPHDNGSIFVSAAKGFRSGTTQTDAQVALAASVGVPTGTTIAPDEVWTYEVGARYQFLGGKLAVEAAYYYSDWKEIQLQFSVPGTVALANGGDAKLNGLDLAVSWMPINNLILQMSGNINDSEFKNVNANLAAATATVREGGSLPNVPEKNLTLGASYEWAISNGWQAFVNAAYAYRDSQIDAGSGLESGIMNAADMRVGVRGDTWTLTLFGENLAEEEEPLVRTGTGVQFLTPRTFGLQLEVDARWLMAYAAGLQDNNPRFMDTAAGTVIAHPVFPVCLEWPVLLKSRRMPGYEQTTPQESARGVHAAHDLHLYRPIRAGERLTTTATIIGLQAIKPGAAQTTRLDTVDEQGNLVCRTYQLGISRGVAVTGEPTQIEHAPQVPEAPASRSVLQSWPIAVPVGAAHIYTECARIFNPIHTDREVALAAGLPDIILHGTATLALAISKLVDEKLGGDPTHVKRLGGRFTAMVLMPSTLRLNLLGQSKGVLHFEILTEDGQTAFSHGYVCTAEH